MGENLLFEERQFIGANKSSLSLRIFLALFCFVAYNYTDVPELNGDILFFLGVFILVISVLLLFVTHIHTRIYPGYVTLDGTFNKRKVKIPFDSIVTAEKTRYSNYIINNPVYNLHRDGIIKFYTGGKDAIRLTDKAGLVYIIGTHKPEEFLRVINEQKNKS
jgi:hypothetical protein